VGRVVEAALMVGRGIFVMLFYPTILLLSLLIGGFTLYYLHPLLQFVFDFLN